MSVAFARRLRKSLTPQEVKLWVRLRELRPLGFHPRRQAPIDRFVADFAFKREMLIVEVDGGQHGGPGDMRRDACLVELGYEVMRVWNIDVDQNLDGVVEAILAKLETRKFAAGRRNPS